jgi:hypothetical protein
MRRLASSGVVSTILIVLSWILVALIAFFYFLALTKGQLWLDSLANPTTILCPRLADSDLSWREIANALIDNR